MKFSFFRVFLVFLCAVGLFTETGFCMQVWPTGCGSGCKVVYLNKNGGTGGLDEIWVKNGSGFPPGTDFSSPDTYGPDDIIICSDCKIEIPTKDGYVFEGYFDSYNHLMIASDGTGDEAEYVFSMDVITGEEISSGETWTAHWGCASGFFLYDTNCLACPTGYYTASATSWAHCKKNVEHSQYPIDARFNGNDWEYQASQVSCDPGYYKTGSGGSVRCDLCPDGEISAGGSAVCTPCESGKEPNDDHTECIECKGPSKYVGADGKCEKCPENQYYVNGQCVVCGAGLCMDDDYCTICPAGKYCTEDTSLSCNSAPSCGANEYSETGAASCSKCATGYSTTYSGPATEGYDFDGLCNDRSGGYGVGCFSADACREIPSQLCFDNSKCGANGTCGSFDIDNSKPYVDQYRENCEVSFPFSDNIKINSKNESVIKKL